MKKYGDEELIEERTKFIKDILQRGKTAVFTRPHHLLDCEVEKRVTCWVEDFDDVSGKRDIIAQSGKNASTLNIALWDKSYTITEE